MERYHRLATKYERDPRVRLGEGIRRQAFAEFDLRVGDTVLDVGCGTGLSFPLIEDAIGPSGMLFGIEPSREMLAIARARTDDAGWRNVTFIDARAQEAAIPVQADALIFFRVHELVRSPAALQHLFGSAKPGARVLAAGVKWAPWWAYPLNLPIWLLTRNVTTTREGFHRPWDRLEDFVPDLHVRSVAMGAHYIAHGTTPSE